MCDVMSDVTRSGAIVRRHPCAGLVYTYRLLYTPGGYPYIEVTAEDVNGVRCEKSGLFPSDGRLALCFFALVAECEVSPYTLVEIYDEFLTHNPI